MASIVLKNSDQDFDLDGYLADQGLSVVDKSPKGLLNYFRNKGNVSFTVKDAEGKEFDFDAVNFLRDQGMEPDLDATYEREQKKIRAQQESAQTAADIKLKGELEEAGFGEYLARTAAPFTTALMESGKLSDRPGLPTLGDVGRTSLAVTADVASLLPRGLVGIYEDAKKRLTGKGKDLAVSMAQTPTYGAEKVKDPETGEEREENLSEHWEATKRAFHADPAGVTKDIMRESVRDPFTGAAIIAAASSGGTLTPVLASRLGPLLSQIAGKYKTVQQAGNVVQKAGQVLSRAQEKLQKANLVTKLAAGITAEGVGGGLQGVLLNYAQGADQDAWNTFVIEGVEEGAFGAAMAPVFAGWHYLSKPEQVKALNEIRREAQLSLPRAEEGPLLPAPEGEAGPHAAPDVIYGTGAGLPALPGRQLQLSAPDRIFAGPPRFPETPDVIPLGENPEASGPTIYAENPVKALPKPGDVPPVAVMPNAPGVTFVGGAPVSIYEELPPGVSRDDVLKKMKDPAHLSAQEKAAEAEREKKLQKVREDLKRFKKDTEKLQSEAQAAVSQALDESLADLDTEAKTQEDALQQSREAIQKDVDALMDPTKETPFPTWKRLMGDAHGGPEETAKAFEDFHVEEAKRIQKVRERIKPPKEGEGAKADAPAPEKTDYIEKSGGPHEKAVDSGNRGGTQPGDPQLGGEAGQGPAAGTDAGRYGADQLDRGPQDGNQLVLPREPRKPRPVEADEGAPLSAPVAARRDEQDAAAAKDPEYRPPRGPSWANLDLRGKSPIVLSRSQRVELNQKGKEILDRVEKDPTSLTEEDREILRHYTGQGGLGVKADEEASGGILNQHYTSYPVVRFAWDVLAATGFPMDKRRTALEPTAGIGNFVGFKPDNVEFHANEVDPASARVMRLLYPENIVNREGPFETYFGPKVDIVITNVPFLKDRGSYGSLETDSRYENIKSLHNYVMMKSLDQLHDNGLGVFITSTGTMDAKTGAEFRKQFNMKAEILGAFRLPEGTFDKNTGYKGTVDLIVVRRRTKGEMASVPGPDRLQPEWVDTEEVQAKSQYGEATANRTQWYTKHPEGVLGQFVYGHNRSLAQTGVQLPLLEGEDFEKGLSRVFTAALEAIRGKYVPAPGADSDPHLSGFGESVGRGSPETPVFGLEVKDGKVYRKGRDGELRAFRPEKNPKGKPWDVPEERFARLVEIMQGAAQLKEMAGRGEEVAFLQEALKSQLEEWKAAPRYPRQPSDKNKNPLFPGVSVSRRTVGAGHVTELKFGDGALEAFAGQDKRYTLLRGLYDKKLTGFGRILTERPQLKAPPQVQKGDMGTAEGVVAYLLEKFGVFRDEQARQEWQGTPEAYHIAMLAHPALNWDGEEFVHDAEYIQGNLREKIAFAKKMGLKVQLRKLEKALPEQKTAATVGTSPIATWWDGDALTAFARSQGIIGGGHRIGRARMGYQERFRVLQGEEVVDRLDQDLFTFVEYVLNQRPIRVPDPGGAMDGNGDPLLVPDYALSKRTRDEWAARFAAWAKGAGKAHAERAAEKFNQDFASGAEVKENEAPLFISGLSPVLDGRPIRPYPSQMAVVRRILRLHGAIVAHGVGHGKTLAAIFSHAELKNRGLVKKPCYVMPSKNRGMWYSNLSQVMPGLSIKVISSEGQQRRVDLIDAANNPYDVILMSYDTFKTIPLAKGEQYIREDIARFKEYLEELELSKKGKSRLTDGMKKRVEEKIAKLESKLNGIQVAMKDPEGVVTFEDLGVDFMFLDEGHTVKNSYEQMHEYADRSFLNQKSDSHIGNDMVYKARFIHEKRGRGGVTLLTATPTPNNPLEIYKIIKLVAPQEWTNRGIHTVDDFIRNFVQIGPIEAPGLDATSSSVTVAGKQREGITGWQNLKSLRAILNTWMDFRKDNEHVKKPEALAKPTYVELNDDQLNAMARILVLAEMSREAQAKMGVNMASLTAQAKLVSIDPAFLDPKLLDEKPHFLDRSPKLKECLARVEEHYKANPNRLQIIFLDFFRIRDFKLLETEDGRPLPWPKGFGDLGVADDGTRVLPEWFAELDEAERQKMAPLLDASRADYRTWPRDFFDRAGRPGKVTENTIDRYRPHFDEEGGVFIKMEAIHENLHDSIERYAVEKLGIPAHRVIVVNSNKNGKPEDKTRVEQMVADGLLTLIIGNKPSIGEGMNLQNRGDAMHHLDVPWTPKELEQANGRMWRPRSEEDDFPISIYNYIARGSLDAKGYAVLDQKEKWQQGLYTGTDDFMDNSLNNLDKTGFSYKEMADSAKVNPEYVAGYRLGAAVDMDEKNLAAAKKEMERLTRALEVQKNAYAEAVRKTEDAKKRISEGQAKASEAGKAYEGAAYWEKVIENNRIAVESGPKFIEQAEEKLKPFADTLLMIEANQKAKGLIPMVKANKWKALGTALEGERAEGYRAMLRRVLPEIDARYPLLADMVAAKALGGTLSEDLSAAEAKLQAFLADKMKGQAGKVSPKLLGVGVAGTALASYFGPEALGAAGMAGAALWAFKRLNRIDQVKRLTWSIEGRLAELPGFEALQPKFGQAHRLVQINTARANQLLSEAMKGMTQEEREQIAEKVERPALQVDPRIERAAALWRRIAAAAVPRLQEVGYDVVESETYFPRVYDFERVQKMKEDPELLDREVKGLMAQGFELEEATGILLNMFDNTDTMRRERAAERTRELLQSISRRYGAGLSVKAMEAFKRAKANYGEMWNGYLKQRKMPQLSADMYVRDPAVVLPDYLERTWKNIAYRKTFGPQLQVLRDFLDTHYPIVEGESSAERQQVEDFFDVELYGHRFNSILGIKDQEFANKAARAATTFQLWTKLFSSILSPARNVLGAIPVSLPLAGGRDTFKGMLEALSEAPGGFLQARLAGAVSERVLRDTFETAKGNERTFFAKLKAANWHPFTVTERYVRAFAFHAGRYRAERLFRMALAGDSRSKARKALSAAEDPLRELETVLGAERLRKDLEAGALSEASKELFGASMAEDVGGSTRPLRLPRWANTPEGTVLAQFRRVAYDQTRTLYHRVYRPATRGQVGPLLRWATGVGVSSGVVALLASMMAGEDEKKEKDGKTPGQMAWAMLDYVNNVHGLGLWGDLAQTVEHRGVSDLAGPTLSGAYKAVVDLASESRQDEGSLLDAGKRIVRRELPLLNKLGKWEIPPFDALQADAKKRHEIPMR